MVRKKYRLLRYGLVVLQAILILSLVYFGYTYHREFEENLTSKYQQQLSSTAASARVSVLSYFEKFTENLINLSHNPEVIRMARMGRETTKGKKYCPMEDLYAIHQHEINALILMDTTSMIIKRIADDTMNLFRMMCIGNPRANPDVPKDSVYYSDIFLNHKNQKSITLSCPVYDDGVKKGILRWMITIESINNQFLHNINQDKLSHFALTDQEGRMLSNKESYQDWLCKNLCSCDTGPIHGPFIYNYSMMPGEGIGQLRLKPSGCSVYAAWNSFRIGNRNWHLLVMMPAKVLDQAMWNHGFITYSVTTLVLVLLVSLIILFYRTRLKKSRLETEALYLSRLADSQMQLNEERKKRLSAQIAGQDSERRRISRELHDGLGQLLLAMRLRLKKEDPEAGEARGSIDREIKVLLDETIEEVKRISYGLSPVLLNELGIQKALNRYCQELANRSGINIEFVSYGNAPQADPETGTHLFRMAQEALSNAIRHSGATEINVQLLCSRDKITLIIQDYGKGFDLSAGRNLNGNGIENMRDRVAMLNGQFEIVSGAGEGTIITIKIPLLYEPL